jgi:hypothetical protein
VRTAILTRGTTDCASKADFLRAEMLERQMLIILSTFRFFSLAAYSLDPRFSEKYNSIVARYLAVWIHDRSVRFSDSNCGSSIIGEKCPRFFFTAITSRELNRSLRFSDHGDTIFPGLDHPKTSARIHVSKVLRGWRI